MANFTNLASWFLGLGGRATPTKMKCTSPIAVNLAQGAAALSVDLSANQNDNANFLDSALSMFVDASAATNTGPLTITFGSGQQIVINPNTQGYYTIAQPNPIRFGCVASGAPGTTAVCNIMLFNAIIPPFVWAT